MSTLATAISNGQWELAAHVLVLAALRTLNSNQPVPSSTKGGTGGGSRKRKHNRHSRRP